jgi:hypothetical protein
LVEANYKAYLKKLKHKVCIQEEDVLDLAIIDNRQREIHGSPDSKSKHKFKKVRNQRENTKRKK